MASTPKITLYRGKGSCSLVPGMLLRHLHIPFDVVELKGPMGGLAAVDGSFTNADYRTIHHNAKVAALRIPLSAEDGKTPVPLVTPRTRDDEAPTRLSGTAAISLVNATVLTELQAILEWITTMVPEGAPLFGNPADTLERARVAEWLAWLVGYVQAKAINQAAIGANDEHKAQGKEMVHAAYTRIDEKVKGKKFAVGESVTVADFVLYVWYTWGPLLVEWPMAEKYPNYTAFVKGIEAVPGVKEAVVDEGIEPLFG